LNLTAEAYFHDAENSIRECPQSEFCLQSVGRPILHREFDCRALGHPHCGIIGKPIEEWGDEAGNDVHFLQAECVHAGGSPPGVRRNGAADLGQRPAPTAFDDSDMVGAAALHLAATPSVT
jgi:hypothetical protein